MKVGIIGLEFGGKKSLFSLLTGIEASGFGGNNAQLGVVNVPDKRVDVLSDMYKSKKKVYSKIEFNLLPSIKQNSEETKKTLADAKLLDVFAIVLRQFKDENVFHAMGSVEIQRDYNVIKDELIFADLYLVETRLERIEKDSKGKVNDLILKEKEILLKLKENLENGIFISKIELDEDRKKIIKSLNFLTLKPIFIIVNCDEDVINKKIDFPDNVESINVSVKIEKEIQGLSEADRKEFLESINLKEPSLNRMIRFAYSYADLISFFTAGEKEAHSWTINKGINAQEAAGAIHSDIERGFIRAEVIHYDDLTKCGSEAEAKRQGLYRLEGKEYTVKDGDVILFRFNV